MKFYNRISEDRRELLKNDAMLMLGKCIVIFFCL